MRVLFAFIAIIFSTSSPAQESILGIDYLEVTKNPIIADAMLEMEPALIGYYQTGEWEGTTHEDRIYALRGMAIVLGMDKVSVDTYEVINNIAPHIALRFFDLDKQKYPNLRTFGNIVRLTIEGEESKRLYKALHGKEWVE